MRKRKTITLKIKIQNMTNCSHWV